MPEFLTISNEYFLIALTSLMAALSFIGFSIPLIKKGEKKEKFKSIVEKRRQLLSVQVRQNMASGENSSSDRSASQSVATLFKVQKIAGEMGQKLRDKLLNAGIRNPKAPVYLMIAQIFTPFLMLGVAWYLINIAGYTYGPSVDFLMMMLGAYFGYKLPVMLVDNHAKKRQEEINLAFPDALDMMLICVQGGIGLEQTITRVAEEVAEYSETLAEELGILSAEMAMLNDRRAALQDFARRVGSGAARSFATALIQAEQYGTSISTALRVMADELRDQRMAAAETKAAALPPKLTVPMILFFLPALFIVIVGPASIQVSGIQ